MKLSDVYQPGKFAISIELFPPKTTAGMDALFRHLSNLLTYHPDFVTCTYGAGGSTRDKTLDIVAEVKRRHELPVATHLTLVGSSVTQLKEYLDSAQSRSIDYVVALRGDPPQGTNAFVPHPQGLKFAAQLVQLIKEQFPAFGVAVAGYPETHREAPNFQQDTLHLRDKVRAGADVVITQLFYDNADFFRFQDRCTELGIDVPVVPGVLPITSLSQIQRITQLCGAKIPDDLATRLAAHDDADDQSAVGVEFATEQVRQLIDAGVPGLHFYVLNQSRSMQQILDNLQLARSPSAHSIDPKNRQ